MKLSHKVENGSATLIIDVEGFQTPDPPRELWFTSTHHHWETGFDIKLKFPMEPSRSNRVLTLEVTFPPYVKEIEFKIYDHTYHQFCEPGDTRKDGRLYNGTEQFFVPNSYGTYNLKYAFGESD